MKHRRHYSGSFKEAAAENNPVKAGYSITKLLFEYTFVWVFKQLNQNMCYDAKYF
jgi:hypothetical protein